MKAPLFLAGVRVKPKAHKIVTWLDEAVTFRYSTEQGSILSLNVRVTNDTGVLEGGPGPIFHTPANTHFGLSAIGESYSVFSLDITPWVTKCCHYFLLCKATIWMCRCKAQLKLRYLLQAVQKSIHVEGK